MKRGDVSYNIIDFLTNRDLTKKRLDKQRKRGEELALNILENWWITIPRSKEYKCSGCGKAIFALNLAYEYIVRYGGRERYFHIDQSHKLGTAINSALVGGECEGMYDKDNPGKRRGVNPSQVKILLDIERENLSKKIEKSAVSKPTEGIFKPINNLIEICQDAQKRMENKLLLLK